MERKLSRQPSHIQYRPLIKVSGYEFLERFSKDAAAFGLLAYAYCFTCQRFIYKSREHNPEVKRMVDFAIKAHSANFIEEHTVFRKNS